MPVNTGSGTVSVIDVENNRIAATIGVHRQPYFIDVAPDGRRAYVANSGSNSISVIDLDRRREIAVAGAGEQPPGLARHLSLICARSSSPTAAAAAS